MYDSTVKVLRFAFLLYYILSISFRVLFLENYNIFNGGGVSLFFDYVADFFYLADALLSIPKSNAVHPQIKTQQQLVSTAIHRQSLIVSRNAKAAQTAVRRKPRTESSWQSKLKTLVPHILLLFPFEFIGLLASLNAFYALRANRLLRCAYFYQYWVDIAGILRQNRAIMNTGTRRAIVFAIVMALVAHVFACMFYRIGLSDLKNGSENTWLVFNKLAYLDDTDGSIVFLQTVSYRYVLAMYWSMQTLTTVGFGDVAAHSEGETWFCIWYFFTIALVVSFTLANLTMAISNFDAAYTDNLQKIAKFEKYAAYRHIPAALTNRVVSYYEHQWKKLQGVNELQIMSELPSRLRNHIVHHVTRDKLLVIEVLRTLNKSCLNALTNKVESYVYSPQDMLLQEGGVVTGVYIISEGTILRTHRISKGDPLPLKSEEIFGERALLDAYTSKHTYTAKTYCEILFLPGSTFRHLCQLYLTTTEIEGVIASLTQLSIDKDHARATVRQPAFTKVGRGSVIFGKQRIMRKEALPAANAKARSTALSRFLLSCFEPNSVFRAWWGCLMFCGLMFYSIACGLLLQATLRQHFMSHYSPLLLACYLMDIAFVLNTIFMAVFFAYEEEGVTITEYQQVLAHFVKTEHAVLNLMLIIPFDVIFGLTINYRLIPVLRMLKLGHAYRFGAYWEDLEHLLLRYAGFVLSFELSRFVKLYIILFMVCHWCGCFWTLTAEVSIKVFGYHTSWRFSETHDSFFHYDYKSLSGTMSYWREIYWTVNVMSSIGWADQLPTNAVELISITFLMFVGFLMFTTLVGALSSLMGSFNSTGREFNAKVDKIRQLVKYKSVSKQIETKIVRYYEYIWARYGGVDEAEVLGNLPKSLRAAVAKHVLGPLLNRIPFFDSCSEPMEQLIVSLFETRIFLEDDALMLCGDVGQDMFIIEHGEVDITSADRRVTYAKLKDGDYVGESCFLEISKRTASAFAVDYVDTYFLTRDNFLKAAEKFPAEYQVVIEAIRDTLRLKAEKNAEKKAPVKSKSVYEKENKLVEERKLIRSNTELESAAVASAGNIHPESNTKLYWDVMIGVTLLYYAFIIPLRIALTLEPDLLYLDYIVDAISIYDCYMCTTVFAVYSAGELLVLDKDIRAHYFRTRFWGDLASSVPYDLIALGFLDYDLQTMHFIRAILRVPKFIRLRLAPHYLNQFYRLLQKYNVSSAIILVVQLAFSILLIMHWVGCVFYCLARYAGPQGSCVDEPNAYYGTACRYANTWVGEQISSGKLPQNGGSQWFRFEKALYWALSNTVAVTMGDQVIMSDVETVFAFFILFFGLSVNGMIVGRIMTLVNDSSVESSRIYRDMEVLQSYLIANNVPAELVNRATAQLRHLATTQGSLAVNQTSIFAELPHSIRLAIDNQVKTIPFLRRCPIFDFCSEEVLRGISAQLHVQFNVKGDKIITGGELGHEMFFVESGSVNVVSLDGLIVYSTLEEGSFFGETALFFRSVRSATVVVVSPFCVCLRLAKADLEHELRSADFDPQEVIRAFTELQVSNERRNKAVTRNLALADNPKSKLFKLVGSSNTGSTRASWYTSLRQRLHPSSNFRVVWDCLGTLLLMYYALSIPFYIAFFFGAKIDLYLRFIAFDFLIDLYWIVDIVLKATVFSFKADIMQDKIETDGDAIWKHYKGSGYFELDVFASIPFEFLALIPHSNPIAIFICRAHHMLRMSQLRAYSNLIEMHLQEKLGISLSRATWFLLRVICVYLALCHWMACGYFMIHRYVERADENTYVVFDLMATYDPVSHQHDICSHNISYCYSRSLYMVLGSITGIGYGDISPRTAVETLFQMVVIMIDAFMIATLYGFIAVFLEEHDAKSNDVFNSKMELLSNFISFRKLPKVVGDAVLAQYTHMWRKVKSTKAEKNEILSLLSQSSAMDLSLHLQSAVLKQVAILKDLPLHTRRRISAVLTPQIAMADTYLYSAGDAGECIYFVSHGSMRVELSNDPALLDSRAITALQILLHKHEVHGDIHTAGDHFGEYCVVSRAGLRPESVKVLSGSEVYALSRMDLWAILQYVTMQERRSFIYELMTRVGERHHVETKMSSEDIQRDTGDDDSRMKALYRLAYEVMQEIVDALNAEESSDNESEDDESPQQTLKTMLRQQSASASRFSQRDLIDLFEQEHSVNPQVAFSEVALRSRLSSFNNGYDLMGEESGSGRLSSRSRATSMSVAGLTPISSSPPNVRPSVLATSGAHSEVTVVDLDSDGSDQEKQDDADAFEVEQASQSESRKRKMSNSFVHKRVQQLSGAHGYSSLSPSSAEQGLELQEVRAPSPAMFSPPGGARKSSAVRFEADVPAPERGAFALTPTVSSRKGSAFALTPTVSSRKGSAVRFDLEAPDQEELSILKTTAIGSAGKAVALQHRSSDIDFNVVRNALEIEGIVRQRRGSTTIASAPQNSSV